MVTTTFYLEKTTTIEFQGYLERYGSFLVSPYGKDLATSRRDAKVFPGPGLHIGDIELEGPIEEWPPHSYKKLLGSVNTKKSKSS